MRVLIGIDVYLIVITYETNPAPYAHLQPRLQGTVIAAVVQYTQRLFSIRSRNIINQMYPPGIDLSHIQVDVGGTVNGEIGILIIYIPFN
jgi:hypothetical protein